LAVKLACRSPRVKVIWLHSAIQTVGRRAAPLAGGWRLSGAKHGRANVLVSRMADIRRLLERVPTKAH